MSDAYYNEWDALAADWLRELQKEGLIPKGHVDERSIANVRQIVVVDFSEMKGEEQQKEALREAKKMLIECGEYNNVETAKLRQGKAKK
jgi:hypothetical protein